MDNQANQTSQNRKCNHPDHKDGESCVDRAVGCHPDCRCCIPIPPEQFKPIENIVVRDVEKYRNPDKRCTYPFTPDAIGYCWSYAHHVDGNPVFTNIESLCKNCEMWKNEELQHCSNCKESFSVELTSCPKCGEESKQRCNHCMAIFSEELTSCPECGKDDALMFPFEPI